MSAMQEAETEPGYAPTPLGLLSSGAHRTDRSPAPRGPRPPAPADHPEGDQRDRGRGVPLAGDGARLQRRPGRTAVEHAQSERLPRRRARQPADVVAGVRPLRALRVAPDLRPAAGVPRDLPRDRRRRRVARDRGVRLRPERVAPLGRADLRVRRPARLARTRARAAVLRALAPARPVPAAGRRRRRQRGRPGDRRDARARTRARLPRRRLRRRSRGFERDQGARSDRRHARRRARTTARPV